MNVDTTSLETSRRAILANQSPRFRRIDRLDRYDETTQYEGKASYWDDSKPLFDRAPAVVYPIVASAKRSHVSMVLGDGRFPEITSGKDEDDGDMDDEFGLDEDQSAILDKLLLLIGRQCKWRVEFRKFLGAAMVGKSACMVAGVRDGRLVLEVIPAKWCTPTFQDDNPSMPVVSLEIKYGYTKEETEEGSKSVKVKALLYRRVIDDKRDVTYKPVEAHLEGIDPSAWVEDKAVAHGLGFCPVKWYRYMCGVSMAGEIDGKAIHEQLLDEITVHDYSVSQRARAVLYTTDPILLEIGVDQGYNPTDVGERRSIMIAGDHESMSQWQKPASRASSNGIGRKRGPGVAYQYERNDSKVSFLTLPPGAMEASASSASDMFAKIAEALCWLPIDPKEMMSGAQLSGRSLEWLHKRQVDYDNEIRTDFGDHGILPTVDMLLRIVHKLGPTGGLYLAGLKKALPILAKFMRRRRKAAESQETEDVWMPPDFRLKWPPYFPDTATDAKSDGDNVRADMTAGIITRKTAVNRMAKHYDIQDAGKYADEMESEEQKKQAEDEAKQHDAAMKLQEAAALRKPQPTTGQPAGRPVAASPTPAQAQQRLAPARAQVKMPTARLGAGRLTVRRPQPQPTKAA